MKKVVLSYGYSAVEENKLKDIEQQLIPETDRMLASRQETAETSYAFLGMPFNTALQEEVQQLAQRKKAYNPAMLIVVGIGGSNMGTLALQEALLGRYYNDQTVAIPIYYADSVDPSALASLCNLIKDHLSNKRAVLCVVISKSGTTTETVANGQIIIELLKKHAPSEYREWIVVITDKNSCLWRVAQQEQFAALEIPAMVGGRFSVFSPVGLFPLSMLGIDIEQLCQGARQAFEMLKMSKNSAAASAAFIYAHYEYENMPVNDTFIFCMQLEGFGHWYRQLVGESLGKKRYDDGVAVGIVPTVSMGTIDLHSVGQLYLGGPRVVTTTMVTIDQWPVDLCVDNASLVAQCGLALQEKKLSFILNAIVRGVQEAYRQEKRPFMTLHLSDLSSSCLGYSMQMKMMEICYLGYLLRVNSFDQPHVESYKKHTRRILTDE
jgi:glucose-6-phosphate isomerase